MKKRERGTGHGEPEKARQAKRAVGPAARSTVPCSPFPVPIVVSTTVPTKEAAARIAAAAVAERLAACAQVQGPISSTFWWQGKIDTATEWYCHLKTTRERLPALEIRIKTLHPYEVPEIIAVEIVGGSKAYLSWIAEQVDLRGTGNRETGPAASGKL